MAVVLKITTKEARAIIQKIQVMIDNKVNVLKRSVKGTVSINSTDTLWKDSNARFTMVPLKTFIKAIEDGRRYKRFQGLKVLNSDNFNIFFCIVP